MSPPPCPECGGPLREVPEVSLSDVYDIVFHWECGTCGGAFDDDDLEEDD